MLNPHQERFIEKLRAWSKDQRFSPAVRRAFEEILKDAEHAQIAYEDMIQQLEAKLLRNPAFPDDLVG